MKNRLAGCVLKNSEGKLLVIHRNTPKRNQWGLPGGKIEENEDPKEAAKRELREELGIDVEITNKLGEKEFQEDGFIIDCIWFAAVIKSGTPKLLEYSFDDFKYFSKQELEGMKNQLSPNLQNLIKNL